MPTLPLIILVKQSKAVIHSLNSIPPFFTLQIAQEKEELFRKAKTGTIPDLILHMQSGDNQAASFYREMKANSALSTTPILVLTHENNSRKIEELLDAGATDFLPLPLNVTFAKIKLISLLELSAYRKKLEILIKEKTAEIQEVQDVTLSSMANLIEMRDLSTGGHIKRTQVYVRILSQSLKAKSSYSDQLSDDLLELLYRSAPLHDIGKIQIPDSILAKPADLTPEERKSMEKHAVFGSVALGEAAKGLSRPGFLEIAKIVAESHHENWDGSGYPNGLSGDEIPLVARIMAVSDVYDALTSDRVYRPAMTHEKAVDIIKSDSGVKFDPIIVESFLEKVDAFKRESQAVI